MATAQQPSNTPDPKSDTNKPKWVGMTGFGDKIIAALDASRKNAAPNRKGRSQTKDIGARSYFTNYWQKNFDSIMSDLFAIMSIPQNSKFFKRLIRANNLTDEQLNMFCDQLVNDFVEQLISPEEKLGVFKGLRYDFPEKFTDAQAFLNLTKGLSDDNVKIPNPYDFIKILKYVVYSYIKYSKKIALSGKATDIKSYVSNNGLPVYEYGKQAYKSHKEEYKAGGGTTSDYLDNLLAKSIGDVEFSKASPEVLDRVAKELMRVYGYDSTDIERARQIIKDPKNVLPIYKKVAAEYANEKRDERERLAKNQTRLQHFVGKALKGSTLGLDKAYDFLMRTPEENVQAWKDKQAEKEIKAADAYAKHEASLKKPKKEDSADLKPTAKGKSTKKKPSKK